MKKQILIFDDEKHVITILNTFLQQEDYEVHTFTNPLEFHCIDENFSSCQNHKSCFSYAIITDFNMPGMNGLQFIELLKKRNCRIKKIALMSGYINDISQFEDFVIDKKLKFFQKPFVLSDVKQWLEESV